MPTKPKKPAAKKARVATKHTTKSQTQTNQSPFASVMIPLFTALSIVFLIVILQNYL